MKILISFKVNDFLKVLLDKCITKKSETTNYIIFVGMIKYSEYEYIIIKHGI